MKSKLLFLFFFASLLGSNSWAQDFSWQAQLPLVQTKGYHRILLTPEITGHSQPDLADVRLMNAAGQAVPYLLRKEVPVKYKRLFKPYQILSYTRRPGRLSELLVHNPQQRAINNLSLLIGNAEVRKQVALSGSDDQQNWYVLKERDLLYAIQNTQSTAEVKLLDFPLSKYRYFRLQLNDSASAPLNILKVGYYDTFSETGKYTRIPVKSTSRTDSANHTTYLRLTFAQPVYPEQVAFYISGSQLYHRQGKIVMGERKVRKGSRRQRRRARRLEISTPLLLSSNALAVQDVPRHKTEKLVIQIENADNLPLAIDSVQVRQLNRYLVATLDPGQVYTLRYGDEDLSAPDYDLAFFQDSIPKDAPLLIPQKAQALKAEKTASPRGSKLLIWAAIALVALGLGYMTVKLMRDMEKRK